MHFCVVSFHSVQLAVAHVEINFQSIVVFTLSLSCLAALNQRWTIVLC